MFVVVVFVLLCVGVLFGWLVGCGIVVFDCVCLNCVELFCVFMCLWV